MSNCLFCRIVSGTIPSTKIREDQNHLAFLDLFPNRKAMTLVIPKKHFGSDISLMSDIDLQKYILAVKTVSQLLKTKLNVDRIGLVVEWLEVDHAHFRLYPFYDNIWFPNWVGAGPQATAEELETISKQITE